MLLDLLLVLGCGGGSTDPDPTPPSADAPEPDPGQPAEVTIGAGTLKPKRGRVLLKDLAAALELEAASLCRELGETPCLEVHGVGLGEIAPRFLRIYRPIDGLLTGVVARDRVALHACAARVARDAADERVILPEGLGVLGDADARGRVVDRLAARLLDRQLSDDDRADLVGLYATLRDQDVADPEAQWAIGSCFAIATLSETLFY
ncbi:MAG: hypothetical protein AAF602_16395 [Myxococcota bacterium]